MVYLLFLFQLYINYSFLQRYRPVQSFWKLLLISFPTIFWWCIIIGGQDHVGSDYENYLYFFKGGDLSYIYDRGEVFFAGFIDFCNNLGIVGQGVFFALALIFVVILLYVIYAFWGSQYLWPFFFVFMTYSAVFNNQMNGIRQFFAVYLFTLGIVLLYRKKILWSVIPFFLMTVTHGSSVVILPCILFFYFFTVKGEWVLSRKVLCLMLLGALILALSVPADLFVRGLSYFEQYSYYEEVMEERGALQLITKIVYIPLLLYAILLFPKFDLSKKRRSLFCIGVMAFAIYFAFSGMSIVGRIGYYFQILMCIPLVELLMYLYMQRKRSAMCVVLLYLLIPYSLKVTLFAVAEYTYQSVFL